MAHLVENMAYVGQTPWHGFGRQLKSGFELETAGALKGGRKLWALAKTGQSAALKGKDVTNGYLLLATACDGTMATIAQFTIRVVCNNTLSVAVGNNPGAVKVPHRSVFNPESVKQSLGISVSARDDFMYRLKHLSNRTVKDSEARSCLLRVMPDPGNASISNEIERNMGRVLALHEGEATRASFERGSISWKRSKDSSTLDTKALLQTAPRALAARLAHFQALSGGLLVCHWNCDCVAKALPKAVGRPSSMST